MENPGDPYLYYQLLRAQGMPAQQAVQMAFPEGLPNRQQQLEQQRKEQAEGAQDAGIAQIGGLLAGALGTRYLVNSLLADGVAPEVATAIAGQAASSGALGSAVGSAGADTAGAFLTSGAGGAGGGGSAATAGATAAESAGGLGLSGIGSAGNFIAPGLGVIGLADLFANERQGARGIGQGAASGAALGSYFGPLGAGIGAGLGGLVGLAGGMFDRETTKEERHRRFNDLKSKNILMHTDKVEDPTMDSDGRYNYNPNAAADFIGLDSAGSWTNNPFAESRDVSTLRPEDIWGYSSFYETFGNDWLGKYNEDQRRQIAKTLLDEDAVTEGRGQISFNQDRARQIADLVFKGEGVPMTSSTSPIAETLANRLPERSLEGLLQKSNLTSNRMPLTTLMPSDGVRRLDPQMPEPNRVPTNQGFFGGGQSEPSSNRFPSLDALVMMQQKKKEDALKGLLG